MRVGVHLPTRLEQFRLLLDGLTNNQTAAAGPFKEPEVDLPEYGFVGNDPGNGIEIEHGRFGHTVFNGRVEGGGLVPEKLDHPLAGRALFRDAPHKGQTVFALRPRHERTIQTVPRQPADICRTARRQPRNPRLLGGTDHVEQPGVSAVPMGVEMGIDGPEQKWAIQRIQAGQYGTHAQPLHLEHEVGREVGLFQRGGQVKEICGRGFEGQDFEPLVQKGPAKLRRCINEADGEYIGGHGQFIHCFALVCHSCCGLTSWSGRPGITVILCLFGVFS